MSSAMQVVHGAPPRSPLHIRMHLQSRMTSQSSDKLTVNQQALDNRPVCCVAAIDEVNTHVVWAKVLEYITQQPTKHEQATMFGPFEGQLWEPSKIKLYVSDGEMIPSPTQGSDVWLTQRVVNILLATFSPDAIDKQQPKKMNNNNNNNFVIIISPSESLKKKAEDSFQKAQESIQAPSSTSRSLPRPREVVVWEPPPPPGKAEQSSPPPGKAEQSSPPLSPILIDSNQKILQPSSAAARSSLF